MIRAPEEEAKIEGLKQDVKFVNSLLSQCGLESPFPFSPLLNVCNDFTQVVGTADLYNLETAVKIMISLLNSKQRENAFRCEMEERSRRLSDDLESREILINKFHAKLEASEKELRVTQQQLRESQARVTQVEGIANSASEEANRLRSAFVMKEKHFNNELRKREREFEKLRDQLQTCLREPSTNISSMTRIENTVLSTRPRNMSLSMVSDEDLSNVNVEQGDDGQQVDRMELLENENANMRQLLLSINQILGEMRQTANHLSPTTIMDDDSADDNGKDEDEQRDLTEHLSTLPVLWVYDQLKEQVETSLAIIGDYLKSSL